MASVREVWPSAFDPRSEERLRGIGHYMSPKVWLGQFGFTMYHAATVPLNVGLHCDHAFCLVSWFPEVHAQIVGFGKMQQGSERDVNTLYLEEPMASIPPITPCITRMEVIHSTSSKGSHRPFLWLLKCCPKAQHPRFVSKPRIGILWSIFKAIGLMPMGRYHANLAV